MARAPREAIHRARRAANPGRRFERVRRRHAARAPTGALVVQLVPADQDDPGVFEHVAQLLAALLDGEDPAVPADPPKE